MRIRARGTNLVRFRQFWTKVNRSAVSHCPRFATPGTSSNDFNIDVGGRCWKRNVLMTTLRFLWRFWPFWSPKSTIFFTLASVIKNCHQHQCHPKKDHNIKNDCLISPTYIFILIKFQFLLNLCMFCSLMKSNDWIGLKTALFPQGLFWFWARVHPSALSTSRIPFWLINQRRKYIGARLPYVRSCESSDFIGQ